MGYPPAFSKSFSPETIGPGSVATLRFDIDNTSEVPTDPVDMLTFTDTLPSAIVIAAPANVTNTCSGIVTASDGGGTISLTDGKVGANDSCFITVNVTSILVGEGPYTNTTGDLTSSAGNSGPATAGLTVDDGLPGFSKDFAPDPVPLGSRSTLTFTIDNSANGSDIEDVIFNDILPAGMVIADPANAATDCDDPLLPTTLTAVSGTSFISLFSNGGFGFPALGAEATCTVTVDVIGSGTGTLGNVSDELFVDAGGEQSSGKASATLEVTDPGSIHAVTDFTDDPTPPGGMVNAKITIANFDRDFTATDIGFSLDLGAVISGITASSLPAIGFCGAGSTTSFSGGVLSAAGGSLAAGASCMFNVTLDIPAGTATDSYDFPTDSLNATLAGATVTADPVTDTLFVSDAPILTKEFIDDPVGAGGTVTLRFTITNTNPNSSLTDIEFTDDLNSAILGLAANSLVTDNAADPLLDVCGMGSELTVIDPPDIPSPPIVIPADSTQLIFRGGSLAAAGSPGDSCTFDVPIEVPAGTPTGTYVNTTSELTGEIFGEVGVTGLPASGDLLVVGAPRLMKVFTDDPVQPGDTVILEFTLSHNPDAPGNATEIAFSDDLNAALAGLSAIGLPQNDICGAGSQISGTTNVGFTGGSLAPGASCTFSATLQVPSAAPYGSHTNTTSEINATVQGVAVTGNASADDLKIPALMLTKSFTDDPVLPGGTVTLEFTIENVSASQAATNIVFTDDLGAVITDLAAAAAQLPLSDPCGDGSTLTGSTGDTILTFGGGSLAAGELCTFSVMLQVPLGADSDTYINSTNAISATVDGSTVLFDNASDELTVNAELLFLAKSFTDDPVAPGGTVNLEFTLTLDSTAPGDATGITFNDNIDAALNGLVATGLPLNDICGVGSQLSGTSDLKLSDGTLAPGNSCTFSVALQIPAAAPAGNYINTTTAVGAMVQTLPVGGNLASDTLNVGIDTDGDGIVNELDDDDDNDGLRDQFEVDNNFDPLNPDTDFDGIIDSLDRLPGMQSNFCLGLGDDAVLATVIVPSGTELTCAASGSIMVEATVVIENSGNLEVITPNADFKPGFDAPEGAGVSVISRDPSAPLP
jgi:hypothetical protein